jgi:hypothetical protein
MRQQPAQFNVLPDKSGVPVETMRLNFWSHPNAANARPDIVSFFGST